MEVFLVLSYIFFAGVSVCPIFSFVKNTASSNGKFSGMDTIDVFMTFFCTFIGMFLWPIVALIALSSILKKLLVKLDL